MGDVAYIVAVSADDPARKQQVFRCTVAVNEEPEAESVVVTSLIISDPTGFSGAPVVNASGHLLGIIRTGRTEGEKWRITTVNARKFAPLID